MEAYELKCQRINTLSYIAANANSIVLTRKVRSDDGAGGESSELISLASQWSRLVFRADPPPSSGDMTSLRASPSLLMRWDADVEFGDKFEINSSKFEVTAIAMTNDYETIALCELLGGGQQSDQQLPAELIPVDSLFWSLDAQSWES